MKRGSENRDDGDDWQEALDVFVEQWSRKTEVIGIIVAGSYILGNPSAHSDIDVCIVLQPGTPWRERGNSTMEGYVFEYFASSPQQFVAAMENDYTQNKNVITHMLSSGTVVYEKGDQIASLQKEATRKLKRPFAPMTSDEKKLSQYALWDSLENVREIVARADIDRAFVYLTHLALVYATYARFLRLPVYKSHKVHRMLFDKQFQKKYNERPFPDPDFVKQWKKCLQVEGSKSALKNIEHITEYVQNSMGGFAIDGFRLRQARKD